MVNNAVLAKTMDEAIAELTKPGAEFEVDVKTINGVATRFFKNIPETLPEFYRVYCDKFAERDFLVWYDDRLTFSQVYGKAAIVAHVLKNKFNVKKRDRVAIACRNFPEWVFALMGITSIGAIAVAMNSWWQSDELAYGLEDSGSRIVFADQERANRLCDRIEELGVQVIVIRPEGEQLAGTMTFDDFMSSAEDAEMPEMKLDADEDILIMYTSGSTGRPKGSVSSHRNILTALFSWKFGIDVRKLLTPPGPLPPGVPEIQAVLCNLPLFHVTGCFAQLLFSMILGRKVVMMYKWNAEEALKLIEKERITYFTTPASLDWDLMESPSFKKTDLSSVLIVGGGGSPRPAESVLRIDREFPNAMPVNGWGMTETNAIGARVAGADYVARPDCAGYPEYILDLKVVDTEGNEVFSGEQGEIWIKGAAIIRGYWNRPEASAETITDGWLHTGDVGYLDEDGYLYICDRITDMILRGGENVYCAEIESVLYEHPAILEATVFGVPDRRLGEVPATVIVPRENSTLTEEEVRDHVGTRLAKFKVPEYVWFSEKQLCRNASGKIFKRKIRKEMIETALG